MIYEPLIENLMQHFTSGPYTEDVAQAKKEFFDRAGIFDEESPDFEMKMAQFMDWYLFTRKLNSQEKPPVQEALEEADYSVSEDERPLYENLAQVEHSLFEFIKLKGDDVYIKDLYTGKKHVIKESPITVGFNKGEVFEARLIPHEDSFIFTKSFCFHPPQVTKFILKEIKKVKKLDEAERQDAKENLIVRLFKMRYKHEQYRHVDVKQIYSNESKLRI